MRKPTYKELEYLFELEKQAHDLTKRKLESAMIAAQSLDEPIPYVLTEKGKNNE